MTNSRQLSGLRVLIVDDNQQDRMLLMDFLGQQGCRVYMAGDGQDGYRKAQVVQPDIILMDVSMPVCDGLVAGRLLKADASTQAIPLIFLTAAALPQERVAGLAVGAVDYVTKPFDFEEVRLRLSIHLKLGAESVDLDRAEVAEALSNAPGGAAGSGSNRLDAVLFRATRKLLLAQLDETPDLAGLSQAVGTNSRRLNLAFKRCVGITVFDYLREERMKEARRLLCDTTLDIQSIARALGYGGGANFATAFRERFGMAPSVLRQTQDERD